MGVAGTVVSAAAASLSMTATAGADRRFVALETPVEIPLESLQQLWEPVPFRARFVRPNGKPAVAPGIAVRVPRAGIQTFCLYCPHELCLIDLTESRELFCTCHASTFDPLKDGARIAGPATRGTYQFECVVAKNTLTVTGIEADIEELLP